MPGLLQSVSALSEVLRHTIISHIIQQLSLVTFADKFSELEIYKILTINKFTLQDRMHCSHPGCKKSFKQRANQLEHVQWAHRDKKECPCNICKKLFQMPSIMRSHQTKTTWQSFGPNPWLSHRKICTFN